MISVLLVEDTTDLMAATRSALEKSGDLRVEIAHSPKHAIEKLKTKSYDVIVSYYQIPAINGIEFMADMNGVELIRFLRSQGNSTPFLLFNRTRPDCVTIADLNSGTEILLPREGDPRSSLAELVNLIKQAVLRKKAERDTKNQNDLLQSILNATPLGICIVRNRAIEWANPPMAAMFGYPEGGLAGKNIGQLAPTREETERIIRELVICIDTAGWGHANADLLRKDGKTFSAHIQTRPVDRRDAQKGEVLVITDMTGQKQLEDALKESEFRYRELQQNAQSLVLRTDTRGAITFFNTYAQSFFGYSGEEITGKNVAGTILPSKGKGADDLTSSFTDIGVHAEGYALAIHENIRRNGDRVWIAWTKKAIKNREGHIAEILCIGHDITDHKHADEGPRISTDSWRDQVIADTDVEEEVFDAVFHICTEISKEGREGKQIGTAFLLGDTGNVLQHSRQLILNPFEGHKPENRMATSNDLKEMIKEYAQLDGAFVISGEGVIEAAGRRITIDSSTIDIPKGMGTRHSSVAAITQATNAVGMVVSQSGGKISIFKNGKIIKTISL
jgi:PAS domain S-box-containing protein